MHGLSIQGCRQKASCRLSCLRGTVPQRLRAMNTTRISTGDLKLSCLTVRPSGVGRPDLLPRSASGHDWPTEVSFRKEHNCSFVRTSQIIPAKTVTITSIGRVGWVSLLHFDQEHLSSAAKIILHCSGIALANTYGWSLCDA